MVEALIIIFFPYIHQCRGCGMYNPRTVFLLDVKVTHIIVSTAILFLAERFPCLPPYNYKDMITVYKYYIFKIHTKILTVNYV